MTSTTLPGRDLLRASSLTAITVARVSIPTDGKIKKHQLP